MVMKVDKFIDCLILDEMPENSMCSLSSVSNVSYVYRINAFLIQCSPQSIFAMSQPHVLTQFSLEKLRN